MTSGQVVLWAATVALRSGSGGRRSRLARRDGVPQDPWRSSRSVRCSSRCSSGREAGYPDARPPLAVRAFRSRHPVRSFRGHYAYGAASSVAASSLPVRGDRRRADRHERAPHVPAPRNPLLSGCDPAALMSALFVAKRRKWGSRPCVDRAACAGTISMSIFCAGALFLALLDVRLVLLTRALASCVSRSLVFALRRIRGLRRVDVVRGFAAVCALFFVTSSGFGANLLSIVPLAAPFVVLIVIRVSHAAPGSWAISAGASGKQPRTTSMPNRIEANHLILNQVREHPLFGVASASRPRPCWRIRQGARSSVAGARAPRPGSAQAGTSYSSPGKRSLLSGISQFSLRIFVSTSGAAMEPRSTRFRPDPPIST